MAAKNDYQPWTDKEDQQLGEDFDRVIAERLGRGVSAVETRRRSKGIAAFKEHRREWTEGELALLGTMTDRALAEKLGVTRKHVLDVRRRRGIKTFAPQNRPKKLGRVKKKRR